jgi:hypothetical protein
LRGQGSFRGPDAFHARPVPCPRLALLGAALVGLCLAPTAQAIQPPAVTGPANPSDPIASGFTVATVPDDNHTFRVKAVEVKSTRSPDLIVLESSLSTVNVTVDTQPAVTG